MGSPATKAKNKYNKKKYDQFLLSMPKGSKEKYMKIAESQGLSLSAYIIQAIEEKIENDTKK